MFRNFISAVMIAGLVLSAPLGGGVVRMAVAQESRAEQNVSEISDRAERAVGVLVRASRLSKDPLLGLTSPAGKPYWAALKDLNEAVGRMANGAALKDESFHDGLADTVSRSAAVLTTYELSGGSDEAVDDALNEVVDVVTLIQENFSKASARAKSGGSLTAREQAALDKIRAQQVELEKRLDKIESKITDNKRALEGVKEARRRSQEVTRSGNNVGDFIGAMIAVRIIDGLLWGCHWWWGPWGWWYPDFSIIIIDVYDDAIIDMDYDWDYYGAYEADVSELGDEILIDDADLAESFDFIETADIPLEDGLDEALLDGVVEPTEADFDDPDFGLEAGLDDLDVDMDGDLDADMGAELGDLDEGVAPDIIDDAAIDDMLNSPVTDEIAIEDIAPSIEPAIEPTFEDVAPAVEYQAPIIEDVAPMIEAMPDADFGGFDDFGGGMDDLGGGFDDW